MILGMNYISVCFRIRIKIEMQFRGLGDKEKFPAPQEVPVVVVQYQSCWLPDSGAVRASERAVLASKNQVI